MRLDGRARAFVAGQRVARLATADAGGAPHAVPVCFGLDGDTLYVAIDRKPKLADVRSLKRLRNLAVNPQACVVVDRYAEDWRRLAWVMLHGRAEILAEGAEHARAQALLQARYDQLRVMDLSGLPVIALRITRVATWGALDG